MMSRHDVDRALDNHEIEPLLPPVNEMDKRRLERAREAMLAESSGRFNDIKKMNERVRTVIEAVQNDPDGPVVTDLRVLLGIEQAAAGQLDEETAIINTLGDEAEGLSTEDIETLQQKESDEEPEGEEEKIDHEKAALKAAGLKVARLEADAAKYGKKEPKIYDELKDARAEFEAARLEYVEDNIGRSVEALELQCASRMQEARERRGIVGKAFAAYNKLGEWNLEALGYKPTTKAGEYLSKIVSVRTVVPAALLGGAFALGVTSAVGLGALALRRVIAGPMGAFGFYKAQTRGTEIKQSIEFSKEELNKLGFEGSLEKMEEILGQNLVDGRSPYDNPAYLQLREHFIEIANDEQRKMIEDGRWGELSMERFMEKVDTKVEESRKAAKSKDTRRKVVAGVGGAFIGSGALASLFGGVTRWAGETLGIIKTGGKAAAGAVETTASGSGHSAAAEHQPTRPKVTKLDDTPRKAPRVPRPRAQGAPVESAQKGINARGSGHMETSKTVSNEDPFETLPAKPPVPRASVDVLRGRQIAGYHAEMPGAPSTPSPEHAPSTEVRMPPKTVSPEETRPAAAPEASKAAAAREAIRSRDYVALQGYRFNGGVLRFIGGPDGKLADVSLETSVRVSPDDVLKDGWREIVAQKNPLFETNRGSITAVLSRKLGELESYERVLHDMKHMYDGDDVLYNMIGKKIDQAKFLIRTGYGVVLK